ncbi:uncharacterized protein F5147DRAFT_762434 [Suillus discolor]|uniref:Uncharacterized protein n=1 Tax=Suillus discolor TaxID=1912936 RepID=A0A9P7JRZ8_9AGAM|nr:uncharacterized protein F5147DRAFT_762434 [Suillus discolor]KAG2102826.1 hypothetical protein F5147DRAFT_762434 [Suillus discolor]
MYLPTRLDDAHTDSFKFRHATTRPAFRDSAEDSTRAQHFPMDMSTNELCESLLYATAPDSMCPCSGYMLEANVQLEHKHRYHDMQPVRPGKPEYLYDQNISRMVPLNDAACFDGVAVAVLIQQHQKKSLRLREIVQEPAALSTPDHDPGIEMQTAGLDDEDTGLSTEAVTQPRFPLQFTPSLQGIHIPRCRALPFTSSSRKGCAI